MMFFDILSPIESTLSLKRSRETVSREAHNLQKQVRFLPPQQVTDTSHNLGLMSELTIHVEGCSESPASATSTCRGSSDG